MRYMGIDYGTKRVGVALSDEGGRMAFPHIVLANNDSLLTALEAIIDERGVETIVIGQSLNREGKANAVQDDIETLMTDLTLKTGKPTYLEEEQYTTQAALRLQGRTDQTDASAAALILNSFLEKKSNTE